MKGRRVTCVLASNGRRGPIGPAGGEKGRSELSGWRHGGCAVSYWRGIEPSSRCEWVRPSYRIPARGIDDVDNDEDDDDNDDDWNDALILPSFFFLFIIILIISLFAIIVIFLEKRLFALRYRNLMPALQGFFKGLSKAVEPIVYRVPHCKYVGRSCERESNCQLKVTVQSRHCSPSLSSCSPSSSQSSPLLL